MLVDIREATRLLKLGRVVAFPTETAFALGADATNSRAVEQVYHTKKRLHNKKMPILVENLEQLATIMEVPEVVRYLSDKLHPGPLNITVSTRYPWVGSFRISSDRTARELVRAVGKPLIATSANLSGKPHGYTHQEVQSQFDLPVVKGTGATKCPRLPVSTIFNPDTERFIRIGSIHKNHVLKHYYAFRALEKIRPDKVKKKLVGEIVKEVTEVTKKIHPEVICGGSVAKETYLNDLRDIDFFFMFDRKDFPDGNLEGALEILKKAAGKFGRVEVDYAQHPYVKVKWKGIDLEFVAAYKTRKGEVLSATDRSIWHVQWVSQLDRAMKDEIMIAKQFCKGVGVYGAELEVEGFSGYAIEVLVAKYGGFVGFLEGMVTRKWPVREKDPVDSKRNVLASVGLDSFLRLREASRDYLEHPTKWFFFPKKVKIRDRLGLMKRWTLVQFKKPKGLVDDAVWGMSKRYAKKISRIAKREGYIVKRHAVFVERQVIVIFELEEVKKEVNVEIGPPKSEYDHYKSFEERHPDAFEVADRKWVFVKPRFRDFGELVRGVDDKIGIPEIFMTSRIQKAYQGYYEKEKQFVCEFLENLKPWQR